MNTDSVISSSSRAGSSALACSASRTQALKPSSRSCEGDTLTEIVRPGSDAAAARQASRSTHMPISRIAPDFSASGMNSTGATSPICGWRQRSSTSAPTMRDDSMSTLGCQCSWNSPRAMAWRSSCSMTTLRRLRSPSSDE